MLSNKSKSVGPVQARVNLVKATRCSAAGSAVSRDRNTGVKVPDQKKGTTSKTGSKGSNLKPNVVIPGPSKSKATGVANANRSSIPATRVTSTGSSGVSKKMNPEVQGTHPKKIQQLLNKFLFLTFLLYIKAV